MIKIVGPRPRIELRVTDFFGLSNSDEILIQVRPTGNDSDYPKPFDIVISVSWWKSKSYVKTRSWKDEGVYNFPKLTCEMARFVKR